MKERLTTYHCGKAVIKEKNKLSEAIEKLAKLEDEQEHGIWIPCSEMPCRECLFNTGTSSCREEIRKWDESEYVEPPVISKSDRTFLDYIKEEYKYITRDEDGDLFAWSAKPKKGLILNEWLYTSSNTIGLYAFNLDLPMVKWEDSEPWLIEDLKKLEVVGSYE